MFLCLGKVDASSNSQLVSTKGDRDISEVGKETLEILLKLKSLKLDKSIFEEKVFKNLKDFSIELGEKEKGRDNPFEDFAFSKEKITDKEQSSF